MTWQSLVGLWHEEASALRVCPQHSDAKDGCHLAATGHLEPDRDLLPATVSQKTGKSCLLTSRYPSGSLAA